VIDSALESRASCTRPRKKLVLPAVAASPFAGGNMPIMAMYPPSGIAFTPYSVSPVRFDHTVGPNPIMYCVTLTPNSLAGTRCPISCRPIETARPTTMMATPITNASTESTPSS
jgi:hypothetical protein